MADKKQPNLETQNTIMNTEINPSAKYITIDLATSAIISETTYKNRKRARNAAEKKNLAHGAHRYFCRIA